MNKATFKRGDWVRGKVSHYPYEVLEFHPVAGLHGEGLLKVKYIGGSSRVKASIPDDYTLSTYEVYRVNL